MILFIVLLYLAGMFAVGWVCKGRIHSSEDYLLASRGLGVFLCSATLAATHFGGVFSAGGAQAGWSSGLSAAWYGISCGVGLILLGLLTAGRFRDLALYTVPEYLEQRYGSRWIRLAGALLSAAALIGITASQIQVAGAASSLLGLEPATGSVLAAAIFVTYTMMGGLWAVAVTDFVQLAIGGVGMVLACVIVMFRVTEVGGLWDLASARIAAGEAPAYFTSLQGEGSGFVLWLVVPTVMYTLVGQDFYQRLFAARSARVARQASLLAGLALIPLSFLPVLVGMGAAVLDLPVQSSGGSTVLFDVIRHLLPGVVGGIVLSAFLAAIMSSADSLLAAATSHLVRDLRPWWSQDSSTEAELRFSRWITLLAGAVALIIGLGSKEIFNTVLSSYILYTAGIFVSVIGGVLWKGASRAGATASISVGTSLALFGILTGRGVGNLPLEVLAAGGSLVAFLVVSALTRESSRDPLE